MFIDFKNVFLFYYYFSKQCNNIKYIHVFTKKSSVQWYKFRKLTEKISNANNILNLFYKSNTKYVFHLSHKIRICLEKRGFTGIIYNLCNSFSKKLGEIHMKAFAMEFFNTVLTLGLQLYLRDSIMRFPQ